MKKIITTLLLLVSAQVTLAQRVNDNVKSNAYLLNKAREMTPESYHKHPEFGQLTLDNKPGTIELIHLRKDNSRTFLDESGQFHTQQTGGIFNYRNEKGEWISVQDHISVEKQNGAALAGIFRTEMPLSVDIKNGSTRMMLEKNGRSFQFGQNVSIQVLDATNKVLSERMSNQNISNHILGETTIQLKDIFPQIDRMQDLKYYQLQTNYVINSPLNLPSNGKFLQFSDRIQLPESWTIEYGDGELTEDGWRGTLLIVNEKKEVLSTISDPVFYDSFKGTTKESYAGHSMIGTYQLEKTNDGYIIRMLVPFSWLNNSELVYPLTIDPTATNTYAATQSLQDRITTYSAGCQASMAVAFPVNAFQVTGTNTTYNVWAKGTTAGSHYAWRSEQVTRVGAGGNWTANQSGTSNNTSPSVQPYSLSNQTIANGCYTATSSITFLWQGYQTFFPYGCSHSACNVYGCTQDYQRLDINTWVVTVTYTERQFSVEFSGSTIPPVFCAGETKSVTMTVKNVGTQTWNSATGTNVNFSWWGSWQSGNDANPRVTPFVSLASGQSQTVTFNVTAPSTAGSYSVNVDLVRDGFCWFRGNAGVCGPCNAIFTQSITVIGAPAAPALTSSPSAPFCGGPVVLSATSNGLGGATTVAQGLVAYYPFYSNLNDVSGSGLNLTGSGGTFSDGGLQLTNSSSYTSASTAVLNNDNHTISFYMKYTAADDGNWRKIFGYNSGGSDRSPGLWKTPGPSGGYGNRNLHWRYDPGNTGSSENQSYNLNQWYHLVAVKNGTDFRIYINGTLVETATVVSPKSSGLAALVFGGAPVVLREFKIFNYAMSASDAAQLGQWRWYSGSCGGTLVGSGPNISVSPTATTTYYLRTENSCGSSSCASISIAAPSGNPATFGTNEWIVYGYNGNSTTLSSNTYRGYYIQPALSATNYGVSTTTYWSNTNSPSYAGTTINNGNLWNGCSVDVDYATFVHKRKGFPCGTYTFNAVDWDDGTTLFINGVQQWNCNDWSGAGTCATGVIGTFLLDASSEVEIRTFEGTGGANLNMQITMVSPTQLAANGATRTCRTSGTAYVDFVDINGRLIGSINPNGNDLGNVTMTSYVSSPINVQACGTTSPSLISSVLGRRWVATPQYQPSQNGNPNNPVLIRLPFDDTPVTGELASLTAAALLTLNAADNVSAVSGLKLSKYSGPNNVDNNAANNCTSSGGNGGTTIHNQSANGTVSSVISGFSSTAKYVTYQVPGFSEFWLHGSSNMSPLPVELKDFSVKCIHNSEARLNWSTASESNSQTFIIEKSRDLNHWIYVDEVAAAGQSSVNIDYSVTDSNPLSGISYYRLVQVDFNGAEKIYGPISLECGNGENSMTVFPNPAQHDFTIEVSSQKDIKDAEIQVVDVSGRIVSMRRLNIVEGMNHVLFNGITLETGTYLVRMVSRDKDFKPVKVLVTQ